jgi:antitoxin component of MazEF toxin-antitoxin module
MVHLVKVQRAGGSLVVTIPRPVADALKLARGDVVEVVVAGELAILGRWDQSGAEKRMLARRKGKT